MRISLQKRIQLSFFMAIGIVAAIGIISFYYINELNSQVRHIIDRDIMLVHAGEKVKSSMFSLRRAERVFLLSPGSSHEMMQNAIDSFRKVVEESKAVSISEETKKEHESILRLVEEYEVAVKSAAHPFDLQKLEDELDAPLRNIKEIVDEISVKRDKDLEAHRKNAELVSERSRRNMLLVVIITILSGLVLGLFAPSKVVLPFQKLLAAIREVQAANFNVSVNVEGSDELAELESEFNKMVEKIHVFDDMKIRKIAFEKRKLDALANMIDAPIIVLSVENQVAYMNRHFYEMLGITSERVLGIDIGESPLPEALKTLISESMMKKDRFEDRHWSFSYKTADQKEITADMLASLTQVRNHVGDVVCFVLMLKKTAS